MLKKLKPYSALKIGDVILCHAHPDTDIIAHNIHRVTNSKYCHAAIYYGDNLVAESRAKEGLKKGGIVKTEITDFLSRYDYVAVLRQPDAWATTDRTDGLRSFIDNVIKNGAKYNFSGVFNFKKRADLHSTNVMGKLEKYFEGAYKPVQPEKHEYFCSEFVADCFIAVGFISESAAVVFQSDTYSPGELGKESAFGTFLCYMSKDEDCNISEDDFFYNRHSFEEIFGTIS